MVDKDSSYGLSVPRSQLLKSEPMAVIASSSRVSSTQLFRKLHAKTSDYGAACHVLRCWTSLVLNFSSLLAHTVRGLSCRTLWFGGKVNTGLGASLCRLYLFPECPCIMAFLSSSRRYGGSSSSREASKSEKHGPLQYFFNKLEFPV